MTKTPRLNDLQLVLLSHAAQNDLGSALPLPPAAAEDAERANKELKALLRRELLVEVEADSTASSWRVDENDRPIGLLLSGKGREAIGIGEAGADAPGSTEVAPSPPVAKSRGPSKQDEVIAMLRRPEGATLAEMMAATGWLAHSTRAVLTGLRKKGHTIEKTKRDDVTRYRIVEAG
jgi:hypothetical protein